MTRSWLRRSCMTAVAAVALEVISAPATAQIPDTFTNLEYFPKEITQGQLLERMKSFSFALGVRCEFCHDGPTPARLSEIDFPSDKRQTKRTARIMLRMVDDINGKYLTTLGKEVAELVRIDCVSCHRGQSRPRLIEDVLAETLEKDGFQGMVATYEELRERYYGQHTYNFSERMLIEFSGTLVAEATSLFVAVPEFFEKAGGISPRQDPDDDAPPEGVQRGTPSITTDRGHRAGEPEA